MATKERMQNPVINDDINLRLFTYNSNNLANVSSIERVEIYFLDPNNVSETNLDGRRLVQTIDGSEAVAEDVGKYLLTVTASEPTYTIGQYLDVWTIVVNPLAPQQVIEQRFQIYSDLWMTSPIPVVYDFSFHFQPNKFRQGEKKYLIIEIIPNVPKGSDLCRYYENLAIVSDLKLSLELQCGPCTNIESDLRLIYDKESVDYREKRFGYFQLDTTELECGIYDIWFQMDFGTNTYISDKMQLQIFT